MIWADEKVTDDEYITLKKYCSKFGFLDENITEIADYLLAAAQDGLSKADILKTLNR